jgi:hypothetical protein
MKFVVQNSLLDYASIVGGAILAENGPGLYNEGGDFIGANPATIIYVILTNKQWGLGIDPSHIDLPSFNYVASAFPYERHYGINFIIDSMGSARDALDKIKEATDVFVIDENDKFYLKLLYDANASSVLTIGDNDVKDVKIVRQTWKEIDNIFEAEYTDPGFNYETKTIVIKNEAAIYNAGGLERKKKIDLTMFISSDVASQRLNEIMQRESFPKTNATFSMGTRGYALRPGDLVTWTNSEYGISGIFRVVQVDFGTIDDKSIQINLIQAFELLWDNQYKSVIASVGNIPQRTV